MNYGFREAYFESVSRENTNIDVSMFMGHPFSLKVLFTNVVPV
jgi:hypothetical protein